jgi:LuxR family maltose regulon positive regulatory protein
MLTKFYPPRVRGAFAARPKAMSLLDRRGDGSAIVVVAPAGSGKSTLVAQWLARDAIASAWVTLDTSDDEPRAFFTLIVGALRSVDPVLAVATDALLAQPGPLDLDPIVNCLVGELGATTRRCALVLDDYHSITASAIHRAVDKMIDRLPPAIRVVVVSRTEPPLQLDRRRASGALIELGPAALRLNRDEARQMLQRSHGLDLTPEDAGVLQARTEGWLAGLHLVGVALRGQPRERVRRFAEDVAEGAQFGAQDLWEAALRRLPSEVRWFLLRAAMLERFNDRLCDAVTGRDNSATLIDRCERDIPFVIPLDDRGEWFRLHHLLAEVLRDHLTKTVTAGELDALHGRAAQWLEEHDLPEDAIHHALAGHAWERSVRLLELLCAPLFERDYVPALRAQLEAVPLEVLERSPQLAFWLAWALGRSGRWPEAIRPLRIAESAWTEADDRPGRGALSVLYATRSLHERDNGSAIDHANRALDLLSGDRTTERTMALMSLAVAHLNKGQPVKAGEALVDVRSALESTGRTWLLPFAMTCSASVLALLGELRVSADQCRQVIHAAGDTPAQVWVQPALRQLGEIYLEWGHLDHARQYCERADDLAERAEAAHWRARIWIGLARVAWAQGKSEEALAGIERAVDLANRSNCEQDVRNARAWQAKFWLGSRQLALARRWADGCDLHLGSTPAYERQIEYLTYVRLLIQEGQQDRALGVLQTIQQQAEGTARVGDLVGILILVALAHTADGDHADAHRSLQRALALGRPGGFRQTFVEEGEGLVPLLRQEAAHGSQGAHARRLLGEIDETALARPPGLPGTPVGFSEREVETLQLVAAGLTEREIGERLFISDRTVERHLGNILSKVLTVNRTQAVEEARRLGLI